MSVRNLVVNSCDRAGVRGWLNRIYPAVQGTFKATSTSRPGCAERVFARLRVCVARLRVCVERVYLAASRARARGHPALRPPPTRT
jgi:hypothetical protein